METNSEFSSVVQLPQFPGASVVTRRRASSDPDEGTAETVERMAVGAEADADSLPVKAATSGALRSALGETKYARAQAIYNWIAKRIKFHHDNPVLKSLLGLDNELDLLIRPARLLTMSTPAEDCDGFTMLACSMLLCAGVPCQIVTIKADEHQPDIFTHVYCEAMTEDGPVCMDCSQAAKHGYPFGWEAPEYFARQTWGVMRPQPKERHSMHGLGDDIDYSSMDPYAAMVLYGQLHPGDIGSPSVPITAAPAVPGSGIDFNKILQELTVGGLNIAKMAVTPVGYVQTPTMTANYGSGGAIAVPSAVAGFSTSTLLLGALGLGLVFMLSRK